MKNSLPTLLATLATLATPLLPSAAPLPAATGGPAYPPAHLLSEQGSGRATGYAEANKIVTLGGRTHVAWLDSPQEGFRVRVRTLDHATGKWSLTNTVGDAFDNHGGPALTVDGDGYLHIVYYPHHHALRYRRSLRPNDASAWGEEERFGERLTYPTLVCAPDGTLLLTARRSFADRARPWEVELWRRPPESAGRWEREVTLLRSRFPGYAHFQESLAWGPEGRALHLACRFHEDSSGGAYGRVQAVAYLVSPDGGESWGRSDGSEVALPATAETADVLAAGGVGAGRTLRSGGLSVGPGGVPHVIYAVEEGGAGTTLLATPDGAGGWRREDLGRALPPRWWGWNLVLPGAVTFDPVGRRSVAVTLQRPAEGERAWGHPTSEVALFRQGAEPATDRFFLLRAPDSEVAHWLPNLERATGHNRVPPAPGVLFTAGGPGEKNTDTLANRVFFTRASPAPQDDRPPGPIRLHPDNPRYFEWRGEPTVLITSAEHYGALLNLDFDYRRYLDTLAADGLNYTRIFTGAYVEPEGAFNISNNTLAPLPGRFICPWPRSSEPGYANGGNRFDLSRWNPAYFDRLHDLIAHASARGVVVEVTLFCPMYEEKQWRLSPMNAANNVNRVGAVARTDVYTLDTSGGLLAVQEALARKVVAELNRYDNVIFEVCNEPYFGGVTMAWQHRIAEVVAAAEDGLPNRHLIAQNIANNTAVVKDPHPAVSVFNFHYATPPDAVAQNPQLRGVIGDDETGFRGNGDDAYRTEAWDFIIAGGGLFNHLDYSFAAGHEDGSFAYPPTQPGGGNAGFRRQMKVLADFVRSFEFVKMRPDYAVIAGGVPAGGTARALVEPGRAMAIYLRNQGSTGPWSARWTGSILAPATGEYAFHTFSNDGVRLLVDGKKVIEDWTDHGEKEDTGQIALQAGRRYPVVLEYYYNGGQGATKLWWTPPGGVKAPVPNDALRLPDGGGWGLRGEYFRGVDLDPRSPLGQRDDGQVNFAWGVKPPLASGGVDGGATRLHVRLPPGTWHAEWVDTLTGATAAGARVEGGGIRALEAPAYKVDIALRLRRRDGVLASP